MVTLLGVEGDLVTGEEKAAPLVRGDEEPAGDRSSGASRSRDALVVKEANELRSLALERLEVLVVRFRRNCGAEAGMGFGSKWSRAEHDTGVDDDGCAECLYRCNDSSVAGLC